MSCKSLQKHELAKGLGDDEIMKILVGSGPQRKKFTVHKALLKKSGSYWSNNETFNSDLDKRGIIILKEDDPDAWNFFVKWLYTEQIAEAPTKVPVRSVPTPLESMALEAGLRERFDQHMSKLVRLYSLAEKFAIEDLMNRTIDIIQDGFLDYGTVFGPGQLVSIFSKTKRDSKLRDLAVSTVLIHTDRGCSQLRKEIALVCQLNPEFLSHMLKWISRNFVMFGRREQDNYDIVHRKDKFSMLNRSKLCACHFHVHTDPTNAHKGHEGCAIPFLDCSHGDEDDVGPPNGSFLSFASLLGSFV